MFTCLQRRHYNKAPLVWINMCLHWGKYSQHLYQLLQNYITVVDEYQVENTHSILRAQTKPSDTADELRKKAKAIFQSKEKQSNFRSFFTSPKQFSFSHNKLQFLKAKCAKVLTVMVKKIAQAPGEGCFSTCRGKRTGHVTLPTMRSNIPAKTTILPLGYHCNIKPDNTKNETYQGAKSQPQMNPGQFSLAAFTPFTVNVLSPLLVHCAKTFYN